MTTLRGSTVVVTGAGGFIGSHLVERLVREGARVRAFVRYNSRNEWGALDWISTEVTSDVEVVLGDLRDIESVTRALAGARFVYHLGAQIAIPYSYVSPRDFFETNVIGSLNVAQAALQSGAEHVIHTSTSEVYGSAQTIPITEAHPLNPQSPYAASKVGADTMMGSFHRSFGLPVTVLRPFNTFGPRQSARAVIPTVIAQAVAGGPVVLGSLSPRRDMTYVEDTVGAFVAAASHPEAIGRTIQLGTGEDASVDEIVEIVGELLGQALEVRADSARVRPERSEVARLISSPQLAGELINWSPEISLREGLRRTKAYIEEHPARYRTDQYVI